jgi:hypothetical protein
MFVHEARQEHAVSFGLLTSSRKFGFPFILASPLVRFDIARLEALGHIFPSWKH